MLGKSYLEFARGGGGILSTVKATRKAKALVVVPGVISSARTAGNPHDTNR